MPPELGLEFGAEAERLGSRAGVAGRRERAAGLTRFAQQRCALEVTARSHLARRGGGLFLERTQQRLAVAELAMGEREAREHLRVRRLLAAQPLEPRQRR